MKLPPEVNLIATAHYLKALDYQQKAAQAVPILGGKNPHIQNLCVGGVATALNMENMAAINMERIAYLKALMTETREFVQKVYYPGEPGEMFRFEKDAFIARTIPIKMSPHQLGIQEMLLLSEIRGRCPEQVTLFGIVPGSFEAGIELTEPLKARLPELASLIQKELNDSGTRMEARGPVS